MMRQILLVPLSLLLLGSAAAETYFFGWELSNFEELRRSSPISFATGGSQGFSATLSDAVVDEPEDEIHADRLPNRASFGKGWPTGSDPDLSKYIEFSLAPPEGQAVHVCQVTLPIFREVETVRGGEEGPKTWQLRWSVDGFASNLGPEIDVTDTTPDEPGTFFLDLTDLAGQTSRIDFRLYGYDAESSEGSGGLLVRSHKLFVEASSEPVEKDLVLKVLRIRPSSGYDRIYYQGSYGRSYLLQYSADMKTWLDDPAGAKVFDGCDGEVWGLISYGANPRPAAQYFRVIEQ